MGDKSANANLIALVNDRLNAVKQAIAAQSNLPVGGRLKFFWREWQKLGAPKRTVRMLRKGYALPFLRENGKIPEIPMSENSPARLRIAYAPGSEKAMALNEKVQELLQKQVIEIMPENEMGHFNLVFLRAKKSGGWRLILDVSPLNQHLRYEYFSMDTWQVIRKAAKRGMWATSVDFSDAYHHIPIRRAHVKYLCFQVNGIRYWYLALPFGLAPAPKKFTDVLITVKLWARLQKMLIFQYIDDWMNMAENPIAAAQSTLQFVEKCVTLGLMVNLEKSELIPKQVIIFLGCQFNFQTAKVYPPLRAWEEALLLMARVRRSKIPSLELTESTLGKLTSLAGMVPFGTYNLRAFQQSVIRAVKQGRHRQATVALTPRARDNLWWWEQASNVMTGSNFVQPAPVLEVQSDASCSGWGLSVGNETFTGLWEPDESQLHINVLEMRAVAKALQLLAQRLKGSCVQFLVDNSTVVAHLAKQGGTRSRMMMTETDRVFHLLQAHKIHLRVSHIAGSLNVLADLASRQGLVVTTEWRLHEQSFRWVQAKAPWGPPTIDVFANRQNKQLHRYISPCPDKRAWAVDALTCKWPAEVLYLFPPAAILEQVTEVITRQRELRAVLVAPYNPSAKWFPQLQAVCKTSPMRLPRRADLVRQPHWQYTHPQPELLNLHLWVLEISG